MSDYTECIISTRKLIYHSALVIYLHNYYSEHYYSKRSSELFVPLYITVYASKNFI